MGLYTIPSKLSGISLMQADTIVLGAGIVGVSIAVHLQMRGRTVVLVDTPWRRRGDEVRQCRPDPARGRGAVYLSAGAWRVLRYGLNDRIDMHYHPTALPAVAPFLFRYWRASRPETYRRSADPTSR